MKTKLLLYASTMTALLGSDCAVLPSDIEVGSCYEQEGNTNLAQAAYERAILDDEENDEARLRLAALYKTIGMRSQGDALLGTINRRKLTPQQRTALAALRQETSASLSSFRAQAALSIGYDDNININPVDNTLLTTTDDQISTAFTRASVDASYLHNLDEAGGWFLRGDGNFYYQNNASAHDYDVIYGRLYAGGGYRSGDYAFYLPLYYDRLDYLGRDLLQESGLHPDLNIQLSSALTLDINAHYSARRYIQSDDQTRNDNLLGAGAGLFWFNGDDLAYIKIRIVDYRAVDSAAPDFTDKTLYYMMVGGIYDLTSEIDLYGDYQFRFADFTPVDNGHRQDANSDLKVALEYDLNSDFRLRGQYRYLYNSSNFDLAHYTKNELLFGLVYTY